MARLVLDRDGATEALMIDLGAARKGSEISGLRLLI